MRLIDADVLYIPPEEMNAKMAVAYAPTVDAVPIVRCRECKYYWKNSKYKSNMEDMEDVMMCLASPSDDVYCSEGERKDDA